MRWFFDTKRFHRQCHRKSLPNNHTLVPFSHSTRRWEYFSLRPLPCNSNNCLLFLKFLTIFIFLNVPSLFSSRKFLAGLEIICCSNGDLFLDVKPEQVRLFVIEPWFLSDRAARNFDPKWAVCLPQSVIYSSGLNIKMDSGMNNSGKIFLVSGQVRLAIYSRTMIDIDWWEKWLEMDVVQAWAGAAY